MYFTRGVFAYIGLCNLFFKCTVITPYKQNEDRIHVFLHVWDSGTPENVNEDTKNTTQGWMKHQKTAVFSEVIL